MNRDFEFKQLLRAYRAGIISEQTFESEMAALENGSVSGNGSGFRALGKTYGCEREAVASAMPALRSTNGRSSARPTVSAAGSGLSRSARAIMVGSSSSACATSAPNARRR
jgi:hypothetical protein